MNITIAGCGNMGLIYARSFLKYELSTPLSLKLIEKDEKRKSELVNLNIGKVVLASDDAVSHSDLIIIAVKPQDFGVLAHELRNKLKPDITVLSIMAGITIDLLESNLNHKNIIRAMPNSPAELGMGITAYTAREYVSHAHIRKAEAVLSTTGRSIFIENEDLMNAVTAISGSGPAYFFYFVKNMIEAGKKMGMDDAVASLLVKQTMLGAFHLINNAGKSLDEMIKIVASKGGTTEAAFEIFEREQVGDKIVKALSAAEQRARALSDLYKNKI